jgi:ABC-type antimicrobial peptide transport system permease subunit
MLLADMETDSWPFLQTELGIIVLTKDTKLIRVLGGLSKITVIAVEGTKITSVYSVPGVLAGASFRVPEKSTINGWMG